MQLANHPRIKLARLTDNITRKERLQMVEFTGTKNKQHGISMLSFLVHATIAIFLIITILRCIPIWIENAAIERIIEKIESDGEKDIANIRKLYRANAEVNDIKSLTADDLGIDVTDSTVTISYEYESRVPIWKNISFLFSFNNN